MPNRLIFTANIVDDSKSIMYKNKVLAIRDIWQPHEVAKFRAGAYLLLAKDTAGLQEEDASQLGALANKFLQKPVELFEQKVAGKGTEFQIMYTSEDGDSVFFGNSITPFTIPRSKRIM